MILSMTDFGHWISAERSLMESQWMTILQGTSHVRSPKSLQEAVEYAFLSGGKRVRPALALLSCSVAGGETERAIPAGVACEMVHAYSLIHDDLPCMDDDALRRGQPTVHVRFGEDLAVLAGDALQALAFEILALQDDTQLLSDQIRILAEAAGPSGMVGGQVLDMHASASETTFAEIQVIHACKTGALLTSAVLMGVAAADVSWQPWRPYAETIGALFQATDDLLDVTGSAQTLGKTPGKDAATGKATLVSVLGFEAATEYAQGLAEKAQAQLLEISAPIQDSPLYDLPRYLIQRCR